MKGPLGFPHPIRSPLVRCTASAGVFLGASEGGGLPSGPVWASLRLKKACMTLSFRSQIEKYLDLSIWAGIFCFCKWTGIGCARLIPQRFPPSSAGPRSFVRVLGEVPPQNTHETSRKLAATTQARACKGSRGLSRRCPRTCLRQGRRLVPEAVLRWTRSWCLLGQHLAAQLVYNLGGSCRG